MFTCYDLTLKNRLLELEKAGFSKKDIKNILNVLNEFTNKLINKFPSISMQSNNSIEKMNNNRAFIEKLRSSGLRPTKQRLEICKLLFDRKKTFLWRQGIEKL